MDTITDEEIKTIANNCLSMAMAAKMCGMSYKKFKKRAIGLGIFKPNKSHKGMKLGHTKTRISTIDILNGHYPHYSTYKLKLRLIEEGIKQDRCEICGWDKKSSPDDKTTPCELHHINGNSFDHSLENLKMLCPNCHSLTKNYRFRRGKTNESQGRKLLGEKESNSVKPDDTGNTEPSSYL